MLYIGNPLYGVFEPSPEEDISSPSSSFIFSFFISPLSTHTQRHKCSCHTQCLFSSCLLTSLPIADRPRVHVGTLQIVIVMPHRRLRAHALAESTNKIANIAREVNGNCVPHTPLPDRSHAKHKDFSPETRMAIATTYFRYCSPGKHRVARSLMPALKRDLEKHDVCYRSGL